MRLRLRLTGALYFWSSRTYQIRQSFEDFMLPRISTDFLKLRKAINRLKREGEVFKRISTLTFEATSAASG